MQKVYLKKAKCGLLLILWFHILIFTFAQEKEKCGLVLRGLHGRFSTPNYPKMYPNKLHCVWNITVPHGYRLQLNFTQFELEWTNHCAYDYVKVKASNGTMGKYCGYRSVKPISLVTPPPYEPIIAPDNTLEVFLHTDFSNEIEVRGFDAHYVAIDINECLENNGGCSQFCHNYIGGHYCSCRMGYMLHENKRACKVTCQNVIRNEMEGVITSPEFPNKYPPFAQCDYHINAEKGYFVKLKFLEFNIEDHPESRCPYDYLLLEDEKEKKGPYCGTTKPKDFRSFSNWVIIEFKSDKSYSEKGFKAEFKLEPVKCPKLRSMDYGKMTGPTNFTFKETLSFSCDEGYRYSGSKTRTCLSNGTWSGTSGSCSRITCNDPENIPDQGFITDPSGITPYNYGRKLNVHCAPFHDIFGSKQIQCVGGDNWSGGGAYCVKTCGKTVIRNRAIETCAGGIHRQPSYKYFQPWLAAIKEGEKLKCSGILISKEWIITASHCVAFAPERMSKEGNLRIVLGAEHWNQNAMESEVEVRKIKQIRVNRYFDYGIHSDVALIQLSAEVPLNGNIQPICLPSEKIHRNLFRSNKTVVSIGWQYKGITRKTNRCLTVQSKQPCKRHYDKLHIDLHTNRYKTVDGREKLMPSDLYCTKVLFGNNDLCSIMPGSGLVAYHEPTNKWYLGGVLTWSSDNLTECKQTMNKYNIYSKVHRYIKWIRSRLNLNLKYPDTDFTKPKNL